MLTLTTILYATSFATALYVQRRLTRDRIAQLPHGPHLENRDAIHAALYLRMKRAGRVM